MRRPHAPSRTLPTAAYLQSAHSGAAELKPKQSIGGAWRKMNHQVSNKSKASACSNLNISINQVGALACSLLINGSVQLAAALVR
jgi:hypothetical protein